MRRLVRRAIRYAFDLGLDQNFFPKIIPAVTGIYEQHYPEVSERSQQVIDILVKEERAFRASLRKGIKQLAGYRRSGVTGAELFTLYDTFGFPVELSTEEAHRKGIEVSDNWRGEFDAQMAAQRARSQACTTLHV